MTRRPRAAHVDLARQGDQRFFLTIFILLWLIIAVAAASILIGRS